MSDDIFNPRIMERSSDLQKLFKSKADKVCNRINEAERVLQSCAPFVSVKYQDISWNGKRIMKGERPLIETKILERFDLHTQLESLMLNVISAAEELLEKMDLE